MLANFVDVIRLCKKIILKNIKSNRLALKAQKRNKNKIESFKTFLFSLVL